MLPHTLALILDIFTKKKKSPLVSLQIWKAHIIIILTYTSILFLVHFQPGRSINLMRGETSKRNSQYMQIEMKILFALL